MKIGVIKELDINENRVAVTPDIVKLFYKAGFQVFIEYDAGLKAGFSNDDYQEAGASVVDLSIVMQQHILLKVTAPNEKEVEGYTSNHILLCQLNVRDNKDILDLLTKKGVEVYALELMPRISRAQSMDVLSSQSNLMGYMAVMAAAAEGNCLLPMMMTSAGTIPPAKVTILGIGVAGLQAIATAKRLGAIVSAYDIRPETKEQAESLGAKFIASNNTNSNTDYFLDHIIKQDIIITTASTIGSMPPVLISKDHLDKIKKGSILVDLAVSPNRGGNIYGSKYNTTVSYNGITIIGKPMIQMVAKQASSLFAKNLFNFIIVQVKDSAININYEDQIIKDTLVTRNSIINNSIFI